MARTPEPAEVFLFMQFFELYKSPEWQKKRLSILERDSWTCQCCYDKSNELNVHHTLYKSGKKPWEYEDFLLITLCKNCHELTTDKIKKVRELIGTIQLKNTENANG